MYRFLSVFRILQSHSHVAKNSLDSSDDLYPSDLPFPEMEGPADPPKSGRRRARYWVTRRAKLWINEVFAYYSFLELGCPKTDGVDIEDEGARYSSRGQVSSRKPRAGSSSVLPPECAYLPPRWRASALCGGTREVP